MALQRICQEQETTMKRANEDTVRCGNTLLKDPDANVRADFTRNCASYNRPGN
jgi:hypothetical protein